MSPQGRKTVTDAEGRFVAENLPRAVYYMLAMRDKSSPERVELHDSTSNVGIRMHMPGAGTPK